MCLLAEPLLTPDAEDAPYDQNPDHEPKIESGLACRAAERRDTSALLTQVHEPVQTAQQMTRRHVAFDRELVERRVLRDLPWPDHHQTSLASKK